jgi:hypothetical protein
MMANKKASKSSKPMAKKDMKKTKGGFNFTKVEAVQHDISISQGLNQKVSPGQIQICDGSV